ncbi:transcription factor kayak isoform X2 [Ochlerotatus camptorhynchus]|uniref:transcription factor kayak isoform X2 n=1 Tax=Ochlerotatus camptorhynchus TaxID=644619 RepID=UPI0031E1A766
MIKLWRKVTTIDYLDQKEEEQENQAGQMTRDDNAVLFNDVYLNSYNMNHQPLTPLTPISKIFASFDGIHSGVPTKTTPTLTPTTLKNIEQTFMELTNDTSSNIPCQAGFVPPPFQFEDHSQDQENSRESMSSDVSNNSWQVTPPPVISEDLDSKSSSTSYEREATVSQPRLMAATVCGGVANLAALTPSHAMQQGASGGNRKQAGQNAGAPGTSRRNMGGRRPAKANNLSPEEEQKRAVRRERNKQAAARCRRRREDHTNELVDETDLLEKKKQALQDEIKQLLNEKEDLEFLLETHKEHCRFHGRHSPVERKPVELIQQQHLATDLKVILPMKIKAEPEEHPEQPPAKKLILSNALSDSLDTPTPTTITPVLTSVNLPRLMLPTTAINGRPARPASLDVKASTAFPLRNITADAGIGISTPSNGFFNFDSLMDGGTGLTPVAAPISLQSNRGPLDLMTPTSSEPSKLYSL